MQIRRSAIALAVLAGALALAAPAPAALTFNPPQLLSSQLGGGEPIAFTDRVHGTVIYTSHEGTTHLYRNGALGTSLTDFIVNYRNQVNIWTSRDGGQSFDRVDYLGTGFATDPLHNSGFSDPDLTQDAGGRIYDTGIDLANDALFSSPDGGLTWDRGTLQCHEGDRPWLAGGRADEVFLADNGETTDPTHQIYVSEDGGNTCSSTGIPDEGRTPQNQNYQGNGKLFYLADKDMLVEPVCIGGAGGSGCPGGLGVSTWHRGDPAFTFQGAASHGRSIAFWTVMGVDKADTLYMVWSTDPRRGSSGGCADTGTGNAAPGLPLPNAVQYAYSKDLGKTWSPPVTIEAPADGRTFWPWVVGGNRGRIAVTWYSSDHNVDTDCDASKVSVHAATIIGADTAKPSIYGPVDVVGRPIHDGRVCQGGTICVATGADRRLGDYLTVGILPNGCAMVATGDTTAKDPITGSDSAVSHPLFIRQRTGPRLVGPGSCTPGT